MLFDKKFLITLSKNKKFEIADYTENILNFLTDYMLYSQLAMNNFNWDSSAINSEELNKIELINFYSGRCALVKDNTIGYYISNFKTNGLNGCYNPETIKTYDIEEKHIIGEYNKNDFVIIANQPLWIPTFITVFKYCNILNNCDEAINSNLLKQKTPVLIEGDEEQKTTMKNLAKEISEDNPFIFLKKNFNIDLKKLDIAPTFNGIEISNLKQIKENELLTYLGIDNENINKMSGVSDEEVNANNNKITMCFSLFEQPRKKAIEEIKEKFDIDVSFTTPNRKDYTLNERIYN